MTYTTDHNNDVYRITISDEVRLRKDDNGWYVSHAGGDGHNGEKLGKFIDDLKTARRVLEYINTKGDAEYVVHAMHMEES